MVRKKFTFEQGDYLPAKHWIINKFRDEIDFPSEDFDTSFQAKKDFEHVNRDPVALNSWCEKYLSSEQWKKIKNSIRAARLRDSRKRRTSTPIRRVDLNEDAYHILSTIAKHDGVTLSGVIQQYLKDRYLDTLDP